MSKEGTFLRAANVAARMIVPLAVVVGAAKGLP
jgi:hypothetical protein